MEMLPVFAVADLPAFLERCRKETRNDPDCT
jgi:hypothetical protein